MGPKKPVTLPLAGSKSTPPPQSFTDFHRKEQQARAVAARSKQLPVRLLAVVGRKAEKAQPLLLQTSRTTLPLVRVNFSQPCHEISPISDTSICGLVCRDICGSFSGDGCAELGAGAPTQSKRGRRTVHRTRRPASAGKHRRTLQEYQIKTCRK